MTDVVTRPHIDNASYGSISAAITSWKTAAADLVSAAELYERSVRAPGGTLWDGRTAEAAKTMAGLDVQAVRDVRADIDAMATRAEAGVTGASTLLGDVQALILLAETAGFNVNDDLTLSYLGDLPATKEEAERRARDIQAAAKKWWDADVALADQINRDKDTLAATFAAVGALNAADGRTDGESIQDGQLTDAELQRLLAAGHLTEDQLAALGRGVNIVVGAGRMAYLFQMARALDGMTTDQIKAFQAQLPADAQAAFAQGMAILSNPHAKSGVANTEGATDATRATFVPAAGSQGNMPRAMDRALVDGLVSLSDGSGPYGADRALDIRGLQGVADILRPAGDGYLNGSEATRAMFSAATAYAAEDAALRASSPQAYGVAPPPGIPDDPRAALADIIGVAAGDHVGVHDVLTDNYRDVGVAPDGTVETVGERALRGLTQESWGDQGEKIAKVFSWMDGGTPNGLDGDSQNLLNRETANAVAHFVAEHSGQLHDLPGEGWGTLGHVNPLVERAIAEGTAPYLAELAGLNERPDDGIVPFVSREGPGGMAELVKVLDQDELSAVTVNTAAAVQFRDIVESVGDTAPDGTDLQVAGQLKSAVEAGNTAAGLFTRETAIAQQGVDAADQKAVQDAVLNAVQKGLGPAGDVLSTARDLAAIGGDPGTNPATIDPESFLDHLNTQNAMHNATAFNVAALQGLIDQHPLIALDPRIVGLIKDGDLDPAQIADRDTQASKRIQEWFDDPANQGRYGISLSDWQQSVQAGEGADNWDTSPRDSLPRRPHR